MASSLLPRTAKAFHSQDYWRSFFEKRKDAFEWYGTFKELSPWLLSILQKDMKILVIGCGNSTFSAELYDAGYHQITNMDYVDSVIQEMRDLNKERPEMTWDVMDMRQMTYSNGSFDVVFDKGALDAMVSSDDEESRRDAEAMRNEIDRVLVADTGVYAVVTLAQDFICAHLARFMSSFGTTQLTPLRAVDSNLLPFLVMFHNNRSVELKLRLSPAADGLPLKVDEFASRISDFQAKWQDQRVLHRLKSLVPNRTELMELWSNQPELGPKYTLRILDVSASHPNPCVVVIVPRGDEQAYLFSTDEGLNQLAQSARTRRLVTVTMGHLHEITSLQQVQDEVGPMLSPLLPPNTSAEEASRIPFTTTDSSLGSANVVGHGVLSDGERFTIEQVPDKTSERAAILRRLIFSSNVYLTQTECRLLRKKTPKRNTGKKGKSKKGKATSSGDEEYIIDLHYLCFDYHKAIICGLITSSRSWRKRVSAAEDLPPSTHIDPCPNMALIGLGGGALAMSLTHLFPDANIDVAELDSQVLDLATSWFGFAQSRRLKCHITNGLTFFDQQRPQYSAIVIDVDAKDTTAGISCPPLDFLGKTYLTTLHNALSPDGVLLVNVAARSTPKFQLACERIAAVFPVQNIVVNHPSEEDVNRVVIAFKTDPFGASEPDFVGIMRSWVTKQKGMEADPLELMDVSKRMQFLQRNQSQSSRAASEF